MPKQHNPNWGDPVITLRIPKWQIAALKQLATQTGTSVSALIRDQISDLLADAGISADPSSKQIAGQISVKDLPDA